MRVKSAVRLATRVSAIEGSWHGSKRRLVAFVHGLHAAGGEDESGAEAQIDAVETLLGRRAGLIVGDLKGTLCNSCPWRSGNAGSLMAMDKRIRSLIGWRCKCKAGRASCRQSLGTSGSVVGLGWNEGGHDVLWTRRDKTSSGRLDFAVKLRNDERWVEYEPMWCEAAGASSESDLPSELVSFLAITRSAR